jgi:hypothetical protein
MKQHPIKISAGLFSVILFILSMSCSNSKKDLSQKDDGVVQKYLDEKVMQPSFGGKVFSAFNVLKRESGKLYIWAYMQEYYKKENKIELGTGWSVPMEIDIEETTWGISIKDHFTPGDGEIYSKDILVHFPDDIQKQIFDFSGTPELQKLENACKQRAREYYQ